MVHDPRPPARPARGPFARATVRVHPPDAVTRVGREDRHDRRFEGVWREVQRLYATGLHPAIALHVRHRGQVVLDRTIGHLENEPGGRLGRTTTPDSLFNLFSASKIVTATLVNALADDGLLDLDRPVVEWVPEFGGHGKDRVRLRHLLNHTGGIPDMPEGIDVERALATGTLPLDAICALKPQSAPGERVAYSPVAAWAVVQAVLERATGKPLRRLLRDRLLDPLGFAHLDYGVDPSRLDEVALHAVTGPPVPGPMATIFRRGVGVDFDRAVRITNDPRFLTATLASANVIGTPREVSRFLAMLLNGGILDRTRVLSERAVHRMVNEVTPRRFDATFGFPIRYGLGVMRGGRRFSLFGLDTPEAFGHLGLSNVVVFADPARDLVVSFLNTGKPMLDPGMLRWYAVLQRIVLSVPKR